MSTYISKEKLEELKEELEKREKITRFEIADKIASAKELGDLSENFEYQDAKEQQGTNEARIIELHNLIHDAVIVEKPTNADVVQLGSVFEVEIDGTAKTFELVGSTEANPLEGKISNESPLGIAFLGRKKGDTVDITVPSGVMQYTITNIQ